MARIRNVVVVIAVLGSAVTMLARAPQTPPRAAAPLLKGSGLISGVLLSPSAAAEPVRRATVLITDMAGAVRTSVTDDAGRFAAMELPAGRYVVTASKPGYLPTAYGATRLMRPFVSPAGSAIVLSEGQRLVDVKLYITRGSVIAGVVRGPDGRPLPGVSLSASYATRNTVSGERALAMAPGTVTSDARGAYRLFGLPPGDYVACARVFTQTTGDAVVEMTTADDIQRILSRPGSLSPASLQVSGSSAARRRPTYGYAPICYPGTATVADAQAITLGPAEERGGIDFQMQLLPNAQITGTVIGLDGRPSVGAPIRIVSATVAASAFRSTYGGASDSAGQYVVRGIPPGDYTIEVRPQTSRGAATSGWARSTLTVDASGADVQVNLALQPAFSLSGKFAIESVSNVGPLDYSRAGVSLNSPDGFGYSAVVAADGTFSFAGVIPDFYRMTSSSPSVPPGQGPWFVKSQTIAGREVLEAGWRFSGVESLGPAIITLTDRVAEISGSIQDGQGRAAPEYFVVVFPADRTLWTWQSRRIRQARPSSDGSFSFKNLPAGQYLIGAITDIDPRQLYDAAFLEQLVPASVPISLSDGEKKVQRIEIRGTGLSYSMRSAVIGSIRDARRAGK